MIPGPRIWNSSKRSDNFEYNFALTQLVVELTRKRKVSDLVLTIQPACVKFTSVFAGNIHHKVVLREMTATFGNMR